MDAAEAKIRLSAMLRGELDGGVSDEMLAEALELVESDPVLAAWWKAERNLDKEVVRGIGEIEVPIELRGEILDALSAQENEWASLREPEDEVIGSALRAIEVPGELRGEILGALEVQTAPLQSGGKRARRGRSFAWAAMAAVVLVGLFSLAQLGLPDDEAGERFGGELAVGELIDFYESGEFRLESRGDGFGALASHLRERDLPLPYVVPDFLREASGVGCAEVEIRGRKGSMLCFRVGSGRDLVHLFVFEKGEVDASLPSLDRALVDMRGEVAIGKWSCPGCDYVLTGRVPKGEMRLLLRV